SANWGIDDGDMEIALADFPNIRFFNVPKISSKTPQDNLPAVWEVCTSNSMRQSSALAYFFAKKLQEGLSGVPVGLINSTWGGTPAETWIPEDSISKDFTLFEAAKKLEPNKWGPNHPGHAFNAMIYPLIGYDIEGVLWYQGESNV